MLATIQLWQELISGLLALLAGAFIFIQGSLDRRSASLLRARERLDEHLGLRVLLDRLRQSCSSLDDTLDEYSESLEDVLSSLDRDEVAVELPRPVAIPRFFGVVFAQLATQPMPSEMYLLLADLIERGDVLEADMRRLLIALGDTVTEHRALQPRLKLARIRTSDEPTAQVVLMSVRVLRDVTIQLADLIKDYLAQGERNERHVRPRYEELASVQHEQIGKASSERRSI